MGFQGGWRLDQAMPEGGNLWGKQARGGSTTPLRRKQKGHPSIAGTSLPSVKKLLTLFSLTLLRTSSFSASPRSPLTNHRQFLTIPWS